MNKADIILNHLAAMGIRNQEKNPITSELRRIANETAMQDIAASGNREMTPEDIVGGLDFLLPTLFGNAGTEKRDSDREAKNIYKNLDDQYEKESRMFMEQFLETTAQDRTKAALPEGIKLAQMIENNYYENRKWGTYERDVTEWMNSEERKDLLSSEEFKMLNPKEKAGAEDIAFTNFVANQWAKFDELTLKDIINDKRVFNTVARKAVPYLETISKLRQVYDIIDATEALKNGTATNYQVAVLKRMKDYEALEKNFWYNVADGTAEALAFIGEFITYEFAFGKAVSVGVDYSLNRALSFLRSQGGDIALQRAMSDKMLTSLATKLTTSAMQMATTGAARTYADALQQTIPQRYNFTEQETRQYAKIGEALPEEARALWTAEIADYGIPYSEAIPGSMWNNFIDYFSERIGEEILGTVGPIGDAVKRKMFRTAEINSIAKKAGMSPLEFLEKVGKTTGVHGGILSAPIEYTEEIFGAVGKGEKLPGPRQSLEMLTQFFLMPIPAQISTYASMQIEDAIKRGNKNKEAQKMVDLMIEMNQKLEDSYADPAKTIENAYKKGMAGGYNIIPINTPFEMKGQKYIVDEMGELMLYAEAPKEMQELGEPSAETGVKDPLALEKREYSPRRNGQSIVFVDVDKLLEGLAQDDPDYDVQKAENQIGNRVQSAKDYIQKNIDNPDAKFEPSVASLYDNKLSFEDGRHRVLAAKELGYKSVALSVPEDQVNDFAKRFEIDMETRRQYQQANKYHATVPGPSEDIAKGKKVGDEVNIKISGEYAVESDLYDAARSGEIEDGYYVAPGYGDENMEGQNVYRVQNGAVTLIPNLEADNLAGDPGRWIVNKTEDRILPKIYAPESDLDAVDRKGVEDFNKAIKDLGLIETTETWYGNPFGDELGYLMKSKSGNALLYLDTHESYRPWDVAGEAPVNDGLMINLLTVNPKARGKGEATAILKKLTDWADENNTDLYVEALEQEEGMDAERLRGLYERAGFVFDGDSGYRPARSAVKYTAARKRASSMSNSELIRSIIGDENAAEIYERTNADETIEKTQEEKELLDAINAEATERIGRGKLTKKDIVSEIESGLGYSGDPEMLYAELAPGGVSENVVNGVPISTLSKADKAKIKRERSKRAWFDREFKKLPLMAINRSTLLESLKFRRFASITGENPGGVVTEEENAELYRKAIEWLEDRQFVFLETVGKYKTGEHSVIVFDMGIEDLNTFMDLFKQDEAATDIGMYNRELGVIKPRIPSNDDYNKNLSDPKLDYFSAINTEDGPIAWTIAYEFEDESTWYSIPKNDLEYVRRRMDMYKGKISAEEAGIIMSEESALIEKTEEGEPTGSDSRKLLTKYDEFNSRAESGRPLPKVSDFVKEAFSDRAKKLYAHLYKIADVLGLQVDMSDAANLRLALMGGVPGAWANGRVYIASPWPFVENGYTNFYYTVMAHETIHGVLEHAHTHSPGDLMYNINVRLKGIYDNIKDYADKNGAPEYVTHTFDAIEDLANRLEEKDLSGNTVPSYEELITYALTDRAFANYIMKIPSTETSTTGKPMTVWDKLYEIIKEILGLSGVGRNALDDIVNVLDDYVSEIRKGGRYDKSGYVRSGKEISLIITESNEFNDMLSERSGRSRTRRTTKTGQQGEQMELKLIKRNVKIAASNTTPEALSAIEDIKASEGAIGDASEAASGISDLVSGDGKGDPFGGDKKKARQYVMGWNPRREIGALMAQELYGNTKDAASRYFKYGSEHIDFAPDIVSALRNYDRQLALDLHKYTKSLDRITRYFHRLHKDNRELYYVLDMAMMNSDTKVIDGIIYSNDNEDTRVEVGGVSYTARDIISEWRRVREELFQKARLAGYDISKLEDYFPRTVRNSKAYIDWIQERIKEQRGDEAQYQYILNILALESMRGKLTDAQRAEIIEKAMRGYLTKDSRMYPANTSHAKGRTVAYINKDNYKFYEDSASSMVHYVQSLLRTIHTRKFFGQFAMTDERFDELMSRNSEPFMDDVEGTIGYLVDGMLERGELNAAQRDRLRTALKAVFTPKKKTKFVGSASSAVYMALLGPQTAIKQIDDYMFTALSTNSTYAAKALLNAIRGDIKLTMDDVVPDFNMYAKIFDETGSLGRAMEKYMKYVGIRFMDNIQKTILIEAKLLEATDVAKTGRVHHSLTPNLDTEAVVENLKKIGGEALEDLMKALREGDYKNELVMKYAYDSVAEHHPVGSIDQPVQRRLAGNWAVAWDLKIFTLNMFRNWRNKAINEAKAAIRTGDKAHAVKAVRNAATIIAYFSMLSATSAALINLIYNKPMDPEDIVLDSFVSSVFGDSYYIRGGFSGTGDWVSRNLMPATVSVGTDIIDTFLYGDAERIVKYLPAIGKLYDAWFGYSAKNKDTLFDTAHPFSKPESSSPGPREAKPRGTSGTREAIPRK